MFPMVKSMVWINKTILKAKGGPELRKYSVPNSIPNGSIPKVYDESALVQNIKLLVVRGWGDQGGGLTSCEALSQQQSDAFFEVEEWSNSL